MEILNSASMDHQGSSWSLLSMAANLPRIFARLTNPRQALLHLRNIRSLRPQRFHRFCSPHRRAPRKSLLLSRSCDQRAVLLLLECAMRPAGFHFES